jgi:hypothetical protein
VVTGEGLLFRLAFQAFSCKKKETWIQANFYFGICQVSTRIQGLGSRVHGYPILAFRFKKNEFEVTDSSNLARKRGIRSMSSRNGPGTGTEKGMG